MNAETQTAANKSFRSQPPAFFALRKQIWTGRLLTGLASAFFLFDGAAKLFKAAPSVQAMLRLGYPESSIAGIGIVLIASTVLYLIPRTAVFGAILLSAYLGGAVATNVRVGAPLFNLLFPVVFACLTWAGLSLRDARLRLLFA